MIPLENCNRELLLDLTSVKGIQVDKEGYLYIVHIPANGLAPEKRVNRVDAKAPKRSPMRSLCAVEVCTDRRRTAVVAAMGW